EDSFQKMRAKCKQVLPILLVIVLDSTLGIRLRLRACAGAGLHEETLELVLMAGIALRAGRVVHLPALCSVSDHARFSLGQSVAFWRWRNSPDRWLVSSFWTTASLSR